jgi:hypothetical protein
MNINKTITSLLIVLISFFSVKADEGMWLPFLLNEHNYEDMKKMGLNLTPEQLYDINQSSLKDAIVSFGGFCTGEIISKEGLVLTNHHCGFGAIQSHSTVEHDYLTNGFWAMDKQQELPVEGLFVRFLVKIEDVTDSVLLDIDYKTPEEDRKKLIKERIKHITKQTQEGNDYTASIKPFFKGNRYYMYVFETYTDIRLVGAPPSSIGKYGGDTDNWKWPRHTGDFSLFRVYGSKDGKPADYSNENIPITPKHHLPISLKGIEEGDFSMVFGYPGSTQRYKTSFGIEQDLNIINPNRIKIRDKRLKILKKQMNASDKVRIQYASKYAGIANYYKYFIGQNEGLRKLNTIDKKREGEAKFIEWANQNESRKAKYANVLANIGDMYKNREDLIQVLYYFIEAGYAPDLINFIGQVYPLIKRVGRHHNEEELVEIKTELLQVAEKHFKDYDLNTDKEVFSELYGMFYKDVASEEHPSVFSTIIEYYKGDFNRYANTIYKTSVFAKKKKFIDFVESIEDFQVEKDAAISLYNSVESKFITTKTAYFDINAALTANKRLYMEGLMEMNSDKKFYPDANSTMRTTYGKVEAYEPGDGLAYNHFTTMKGLIEKMDNNDPEFNVPVKLVELYEAKDYGKYGIEGDKLVVCFITNNDITGGNSGSPVINGNGELIGCAFDGNWEAMTGDLVFDPNYKRCINADIRYILFIIDKFAGAGHLVEEMTIVQ